MNTVTPTDTDPARDVARENKRDRCLKAVYARDASADGNFVYAVTSTGIFCRPSCPSRHAKPANIVFFDAAPQALTAGFRPCKRCNPQLDIADACEHQRIIALCRLIEQAETTPTLAELGAAVGLSAQHVQRRFKRALGVTPQAYAAATRRQRVQEALAGDGSVTDAIYAAGYGSSGRFYDQAGGALGMRPSARKSAGAGETIRFALGRCSLGEILVAETARGICAISLGDDPQALIDEFQQRFANAELVGDDAGFASRIAQVVGFIDRGDDASALPLDIRGTAFQQRIWQALRKIPSGSTISYSDLARQLGMPRSTRAVAAACAANTLAVVIPCHRVVRTDGALAGYRWGIERKRALLEREQAPWRGPR